MPSATEGMAAGDTPNGEPGSFYRPMALERLYRVVRACWLKSTVPTEEIAQAVLVEPDQADQSSCQEAHAWAIQPVHSSVTFRIDLSRCLR